MLMSRLEFIQPPQAERLDSLPHNTVLSDVLAELKSNPTLWPLNPVIFPQYYGLCADVLVTSSWKVPRKPEVMEAMLNDIVLATRHFMPDAPVEISNDSLTAGGLSVPECFDGLGSFTKVVKYEVVGDKFKAGIVQIGEHVKDSEVKWSKGVKDRKNDQLGLVSRFWIVPSFEAAHYLRQTASFIDGVSVAKASHLPIDGSIPHLTIQERGWFD